MKILKQWRMHIVLGVLILILILGFTLLYQNAIGGGFETNVLVKEQRITGQQKENSQIQAQMEETQEHKEMSLQDIVTKATKRIVIKKDDDTTKKSEK